MQRSSRRLLMGTFISILLWGCSARPGSDCIKLTPTSRGCSSPQQFAEPPPQAQPPAIPLPSSITPPVVPSSWTLMAVEHQIPANSGIGETVWTTARPPYGPYDFIALRRIAPAPTGKGASARPVFLFLPGPHLHGEVVVPDERFDLRLFLARRGIETWTLDYRTHFVPREQIYDSNFMQPWTVEAFVEDVAVAAHFVREVSGTQKIFVGGFANGATFATLYVARYVREDVLGLVLFDGYVLDPPDEASLYRERPPTPNWFADDLESRYMPYKRWMKVLQDIIDDPSGPDFMPLPVFDNRGEAFAHFLYVNPSFGQQGGLSNAQGGYADIVVLARIMQHQDRYWPRVQNHGGFALSRHLAGAQFDYEKALPVMNVPILAFACGNIDKAGIPWSERIAYTARATATPDVKFEVLENWGHLDMLLGTQAAQAVFTPTAEWIVQHNPTGAAGS